MLFCKSVGSASLPPLINSRMCSGVSRKKMQEENVERLPNTTSLRLAYTSYESKTKKDISPLIMNHNLMGNRSNLSRIAKEINQTTRRMVVNVDCRNHGESPKVPEMTYGNMQRDIEFLINSLDIPKACFLGNGMGGRVGMLLALNRPSLIDRLIVINSTPLNHMSIMQRVEKIKKAGQIMETCKEEIENAEGIVGKKSIADKILTPILTDSFDRSLFLTNLVPSNTEDKRWKLNFNALATSPLGVFPTFGEGTTFNGPCLFITGDKCDYLKEPDREEVTKLFPNAKFIRISHTGYWLQVEKYKQLLEKILPFLSSE
ncbi:sn-1-specific diacylglycerol lipase ABHD11 [Lepeophtheirus salmonis]|uniref:sn-1-specific diacylglycerol lipase ABHD11 n=1 Tax=Lepeophtheirus salmonis TaxID=72036 RepID=UPI001AE9C4B2|nr:protein ABHD11-like [Lepeophtheirus salmonis]